MKTGIELIADERREQIEKHGWDLTRDSDYKNGELVSAAKFCLFPNNSNLWPWHDGAIGTHFYRKIKSKTDYQRLIICASLCAAELDRLNNLSQLVNHP